MLFEFSVAILSPKGQRMRRFFKTTDMTLFALLFKAKDGEEVEYKPEFGCSFLYSRSCSKEGYIGFTLLAKAKK